MSTVRILAAMPFGGLRRRLDQSQIYDWAMRLPLLAYCAFSLFRDVSAFVHQMQLDPAAFAQFDTGTVIAMLARISQWMFVILLAFQGLSRLRPIAKSETILPRLVAFTAACVPLMLILLERAPPNLAFNLVSVIIGLLSNVLSVVTLSFLGRSFSVMPEARRLVQSGPYGIVRHPLYLCEMLGTAAIALQYRSLAAIGLLLLTIALQVARARWEEGVLARSFAGFAAYRARTSFLIPSDPIHFLASFVIDPVIRRRSVLVVAGMVAVLALTATVLPRLIV
jgi:protein-S-isoprenylcysteine O-methyltransferase Ste14